jgi:hypothetical protein
MTHRARIVCALAAAITVSASAAASGQGNAAPREGRCADLPTTAETLLCRQFWQQSETALPHPAEPPRVDGDPERQPAPLSSPLDEAAPLHDPPVTNGGTASPRH